MHQTTDGQPLRAHPKTISAAKSPKLRAFLEAALNPYRQFQADRLGEEWIQDLRRGDSDMKLYHIVRVNDKTGARTTMTAFPMPHKECCTVLSKMLDISRYPDLRNVLEEVQP